MSDLRDYAIHLEVALTGDEAAWDIAKGLAAVLRLDADYVTVTTEDWSEHIDETP